MRLPFLLPSLALAMVLAPARAYERTGVLQPDSSITHSEPAELAPYVAQALREWGQTSAIVDGGPGDDVLASFGEPYPGAAAQASWWVDGQVIQGCAVVIGPAWAGWGEPMRQEAVTHEVGHCLGLDHAPGGVMAAGVDVSNPLPMSPDDREGIAALYPRAPLPVRAFLPETAR